MPAVYHASLDCGIGIRIRERGCAVSQNQGAKGMNVHGGNADNNAFINADGGRLVHSNLRADAVKAFTEEAKRVNAHAVQGFFYRRVQIAVFSVGMLQRFKVSAEVRSHRRRHDCAVGFRNRGVCHCDTADHDFFIDAEVVAQRTIRMQFNSNPPLGCFRNLVADLLIKCRHKRICRMLVTKYQFDRSKILLTGCARIGGGLAPARGSAASY